MKTNATLKDPPLFVEKILNEAIDQGASDIYWLPESDQTRIRCRINGKEREMAVVPAQLGEQCVARIKVLAGMLTYRSRIAQDGVIRDHEIFADSEIRVASMPTINGERLTLRILKRHQNPLMLDDLNFQPEAIETVTDMLMPTSGMIILTGPTGCGKSTTIYAMIRELLRRDADPASIITIEDPVECEINGISQVSVTRSDENEWGYAPALRSALRQDVKTLVIGEMRDKEVVKVALDAALTGHRVITSFHAGDIPSVYARLLHQGFESFLIAAAINGVLSQRLFPCVDGSGMIPALAWLRPDDAWRDFIALNPGLRELRGEVEKRPGSDLKKAVKNLVKAGNIEEKTIYTV